MRVRCISFKSVTQWMGSHTRLRGSSMTRQEACHDQQSEQTEAEFASSHLSLLLLAEMEAWLLQCDPLNNFFQTLRDNLEFGALP